MAGKTKKMSAIKQLIQMRLQGMGCKSIAKALNMSKNTVKAYLEKLSLLEDPPEDLLKLEEPVLEKRFHCGNPAYTDERYEQFHSKLDYFISELKRTGVTRQLLWEEYRSTYPDGYGYTQFCYHVSQYLLNKKPTMVLFHNPGEKLFVDFAGETYTYVDADTGEINKCSVFVACLPYSGYGFVKVIPSQKTEDLFYALECCLRYLGGAPSIIVPDNMKTAVVKASRYEPDINQSFQDFANHYGMTVLPTRAAKPKDKAMVERYVNLVYTHVFAKLRNQQFFNIHSLNEAVQQKVNDFNQTRMQVRPYSRQECFISDEKLILRPLPNESFELKTYCKYKVMQNNFIFLTQDRKYYSTPYQYIGQRVDVIYTRSMVKLYYGGQLIAQHLRSYDTRILYVYKTEHLCSAHQHYLKRSPEYYVERAGQLSENLGKLIACKFNTGQPPETQYRSCDGIIRLAKDTCKEVLEKACTLALENRKYSLSYLQNVIQYKAYENNLKVKSRPLPAHQNIRGKEYYQQLNLNINP